jgi:hypothetical protein
VIPNNLFHQCLPGEFRVGTQRQTDLTDTQKGVLTDYRIRALPLHIAPDTYNNEDKANTYLMKLRLSVTFRDVTQCSVVIVFAAVELYRS